MAVDKKKLLNESSYRKMSIWAGLLTEAEAEQIEEEAAAKLEAGEEVLPEEFEKKNTKKAKEDPSTKDAKGTDKVAKSIKGGPSAKLQPVAKPKFNLKEEFGGPRAPGKDPMAGAGAPSDMGGRDEFGSNESDPNPDVGGDKLTVDAASFSNDLALGISQALQKHFGNELSVTANGESPVGEEGSEGGEFESVPEDELGGEEEMGMGDEGDGLPPEEEDELGGKPDPRMSESKTAKKNKLVESMVANVMRKILNKK